MTVEILANGSVLITRSNDETVTISNEVATQVVEPLGPVTLNADQLSGIQARLAELRAEENSFSSNEDQSDEDQEIVVNVEVVQPQTTILPTTPTLTPSFADLAASLGGRVE